MNNDKMLSLMIMSYYSGNRITKVYYDLKKIMDENRIPFEVIVMDDGSQDDSFKIALELEAKEENVRAYQLSRNYGSMYSGFAGLTLCKGACACHVADDEQMPYQVIVDMYRLWEKGEKIIIPCREKRDDSKISAFFSNSYYKIMNRLSDISYPPGGADGAFLDREVIDIINTQVPPRNTMFIAEVLRLGFSPYFLPFHRPVGLNKGKSRWTFRKKVRLAMDSFFATSTFPIRFITYLGLISFCVAAVAFIFYFYVAAFGNRMFWGWVVPGWFSIVLLIILFGGLILLSLGIVAEYIWRIYDEVKGRPGYIIKKKES